MTATPATEREPVSLRRHFEIERSLADRLRHAAAAERRSLYHEVYNDLFQQVPDHPQNRRKADPALQRASARRQLRLLRHFLDRDAVYLEVGAGDCYLATRVARRVRHAYGIEVSDVIAAGRNRPRNFTLVISDGVSIDVPPGSVTIAYSNQLMEHLHPDDAAEQLTNLFRALAPGGRYLCVTPHRYSGPHDISTYFAPEAQGFHLKEYTYAELIALFRRVGFSRVEVWAGLRGNYFRVPLPLARLAEWLLSLAPRPLRKRLGRSLFRPLFATLQIVGRKPDSAH